jgi:hypothetical protein
LGLVAWVEEVAEGYHPEVAVAEVAEGYHPAAAVMAVAEGYHPKVKVNLSPLVPNLPP